MAGNGKRILIAGASGSIGSELSRQLDGDGHTVLRLVRRAPRSAAEFHWSPSTGMIDDGLVGSVDVIVNLSGAPTSRLPWTPHYKTELIESRLAATRTLTDAMARATRPPSAFLSGSAFGYYGDRPGERLVEDSAPGTTFLADLAVRWEAAARLAPAGTRVVHLRTGLVLGWDGALEPLRRLARWGLSTQLGTGGQHWPWVSLHDEAAGIRHLVTSDLSGPVNITAPTPSTASAIMHELARQMHRPFFLGVPEGLVRAGLGDAGNDLLLASAKVAPERLLEDGFTFRDERIVSAISSALVAPA